MARPRFFSRRFGRASVIAAAGVAALLARPAEAKGPFPKGTITPIFNAGGGYNGFAGYINLGGGAMYYMVDGLGVGLSLADSIVIYPRRTKEAFPGIEDELSTNRFSINPMLQYVVPTRRVSPYVQAGIGPEFYNNQNGTLARWMGGLGLYFRLGRIFFAQAGVNVTGRLPDDRYREITTYVSPDGLSQVGPSCGFLSTVSSAPCSLSFSPAIGFSLAFAVGGGGDDEGGSRRKKRRRDEAEEEVMPSNDTQPPPTWGQPASSPSSATAPAADPASAPASPEPAATPQPAPAGTAEGPEPMPAADPMAAPLTDEGTRDAEASDAPVDERPPPTWGQTDAADPE